MVRIGEIEVQFLIEGEVAIEHPDTQPDDGDIKDTLSTYIEATTGLSFGVRYTVHKDYLFAPAIDFLGFEIHIDGHSLPEQVIAKSECQNRIVTKDFFPTASTEVRGGKMRTVVFGNLDTLGRADLKYMA